MTNYQIFPIIQCGFGKSLSQNQMTSRLYLVLAGSFRTFTHTKNVNYYWRNIFSERDHPYPQLLFPTPRIFIHQQKRHELTARKLSSPSKVEFRNCCQYQQRTVVMKKERSITSWGTSTPRTRKHTLICWKSMLHLLMLKRRQQVERKWQMNKEKLKELLTEQERPSLKHEKLPGKQ